MQAVILDSDGRLSELVRQAIEESCGDPVVHSEPLVAVVASSAEAVEPWRERIQGARSLHPHARLLAFADPALMGPALDAGADDVIDPRASAEEVSLRMRRWLPRSDVPEVPVQRHAADHARRLMTLGTVSVGLANDFNNLLTVILGNAALLKDAELAGVFGQHLRDLEDAANRAGDLTDQILRYAGGADEARRPVDLSALVKDVAPFLRSLLPSTAELQVELGESHFEVEADVSSLTQLLVNLVQAVADAPTGVRKRLTVRTGSGQGPPPDGSADRSESTAYYVEVEDRALEGNPGTESRPAFERFFGAGESGQGLGLAIVRDVAWNHRGNVEVERAGDGGQVRVWLPPSARPVDSERVPSVERWTGRGIVLVADDEPDVRKLLRRILVTTGFRVQEAEDGAEALAMAEAHPDARLLILDLTMPRLDGAEVIRQLEQRNLTLPVMLMSGYGFAQARARVATLESARFLKKPFLSGAVLAKVKRLLTE